MIRHKPIAACGWALAAVLLGGIAAADPPGEEKKGGYDQEAMMAEFMKKAEPGEHHAHLAGMEGTWKAEVKQWMVPGGEPQVTRGKARMKMVLGGRFLQTDYEGEFQGNRFVGLGFAGYDNIGGKHIDVWMDSMGTFFMVGEGSCREGGKVTETISEYLDPMGNHQEMKSIMKRVSDDEIVLEMFGDDPASGKEFKMMEINYTRM